VPISIEVRSDRGDRLARLDDVGNFLPTAPPILTARDLPTDVKRFPMLACVDPFGDTCFNRRQAAAVLRELETLEDSAPADGFHATSLSRAVGVLVAAHMRKPHTYLWFVGD
jgi:hypothetical protein